MDADGSDKLEKSLPLWLLAELTYRCPLQCPYCSNPTDFANFLKNELSTSEWMRVFEEARELGALQLGFSGGEPLLREDLVELVGCAKDLGYYTNLITSSVGMDEEKLSELKKAGLDHIQISFQASSEEINDYFAGAKSYQHKVRMAKLFKEYGFPVVLNIVIHRHNIDSIEDIIKMALELSADEVELANAQYYGFALHNRAKLMPTLEQVKRAEAITKKYQEKHQGKTNFYFVIPDYFENRPKPCMNGWGKVFMTITADGAALPCHSARVIPGLEFPNVKNTPLKTIWEDSSAFNHFRGFGWMKEPCRSCPERFKDFGGCRCQAYLLTGDAANTDPVCDLSPLHHIVLDAIREAKQESAMDKFMVFRNPKNSRSIIKNRDLQK